MRLWISGIAAVVLLAGPAQAQESRPFGLEAGVVMGIIGVPYPTVGVVAGPWSVRVSGGRAPRLECVQSFLGEEEVVLSELDYVLKPHQFVQEPWLLASLSKKEPLSIPFE